MNIEAVPNTVEQVDISKLLGSCTHPFEEHIWCSYPLTEEMVQDCITKGEFIEHSWQDAVQDWTIQQHAARVAYLVTHGWEHPILIDFGVPVLGWNWYPLTDGHHRLAASIFMKREWISADCAGDVEEIQKYLWSN